MIRGQGVRDFHLFFTGNDGGGGRRGQQDMHQRAMATSGWGRVVVLAAILLYWPLDARALSLGELNLFSALNEPFYAEIPLSSVTDNDLKTLKARVVDRPDFDAPGFQRGLLSPVRVNLVSEGDRHILRIRSEHGVYEPVVRFFLQVDWAGGRLQREFTALVDPRAPGETPVLPPAEKTEAAGQSKPTEVDVSSLPTPEPRTGAQRALQPAVTTDPGAAAKPVPEKTRATPLPSKAADPIQPEQPVKAADPDTDDRNRAAQRERIESEIRAWAEEQQQDRRKKTAEDEGTTKARGEETKPVAEAPVVRQAPPRTKAPVVAPPAESVAEPTLSAWVLQNWGRLLTLLVLIIGAAALAASLALAFVLYKRQRLAVGENAVLEGLEPQPEADETVSLLLDEGADERRGGPDRRHHVVPVAVDRRQQPRRSSDRVQASAAGLYPVEGDTTREVNSYLAAGRTDQAEHALREAISRQPWRHGLKVKLLGILYKQNKRDAFETLVNQLYVAVEEEARAPLPQGAGANVGVGPVSPANVTDAQEAETLRIEGQQRGPTEGVEPQSEGRTPEALDYPDKGRERESHLTEAMEALELELPHVNPHVLEREMEALDMDVPKGEDEPTHLIMAGANTGDQVKPVDRNADKHSDAEGDKNSVPLARESLEDIRSAVARGIELLETQAGLPPDDMARSSTGTTKGRDRRRGKRGVETSQQAARLRWQDPAIRIDLAKAYIDMGDVERARRILEEMLEAWDKGDGARG